MLIRHLLQRPLLIGLMLFACSCASDSVDLPQPSNGSMPKPSNAQPSQPPKVNQPGVPNNVPGARTSEAAPPPDARFTIFCSALRDPNHVATARRLKDQLIEATKMKDWYVVHEEGQSLLYYGYYRVIKDAADKKESDRAQIDRQRIDLMADNMGNRPFKQAVFVELASPDPAAPPEWNILNTTALSPKDCTLQIAVYKDSVQRKQAAVDTVREARAQGIEAYYYHGPTMSLVCVGHWPSSAYRMIDAPDSQRSSSDRPLMIVPETGNDQLNQNFSDVATASNAQLIQPKFVIVDPTLRSAMEKFPRCSVNGMDIKRVFGGRETFEPSQPVSIPREEARGMASNGSPNPGAPAYDPTYIPKLPRTVTAEPPPAPGVGRLRGVGG